jgi:hypothetical protein
MKTSQLSSLKLFAITVFLLLFILSFATCKREVKAPPSPPVDTTKVSPPMVSSRYDSVGMARLDSLYTRAMKESQNPSPQKIYDHLLPIEGNSNLIDTLIKGERYVQMVSWKSHPSYYSKKGIDSTQGYDIWVTAAPIIKDSCRSFFKTQKDPIMRLRQLLGLQPFTQETFFLEVWVKPSDLYRPCPDNETTDTVCELNVPDDITEGYRMWFNHTRAVQYNDCTDTEFHEYGYPWTQLGYTYDWSPENPSHIGLSEFVIRRHVNIYVRGKYKTAVYCGQ